MYLLGIDSFHGVDASRRTDSVLEEDLNIVRNSSGDVWDALVRKVMDLRGRLVVETSDLRGAGVNNCFYRTFTSCSRIVVLEIGLMV